MTMQANPQYADVIAGKCRDFIYSDDDSSSVSTHGTGANIDQFALKNKIEGTESEYFPFPVMSILMISGECRLVHVIHLMLYLVRLSIACDLCE
jgi:hypothetical protein